MTPIIAALIEYGITGIFIALLVFALVKKDKQVSSLFQRLLKRSETDAQKYRELADGLQRAMHELLTFIRGSEKNDRK